MSEPRRERVLVVLHAHEKELLQNAAKLRGLSMASFVRSAALDAATKSAVEENWEKDADGESE